MGPKRQSSGSQLPAAKRRKLVSSYQEFNEEVCRDLATDKLTVDFLSEILGKVIKMSDTGKESKFPWEKMAANPKPLMRAILQSFLCSSSYAEWDTEWINSTAKSIYYMAFQELYSTVGYTPDPVGTPPSTWARQVLGPFTSRIDRSKNLAFKEFIGFVIFKIYEFKEPGKDNFGELCPIINTACEAFLVGLAEKLAVIKKPLVVPAELSGVFRTTDELARLENQEDDRVLPTEPEDENAADQAAVDKMVNACVTLIAVSLKSADEKANEIRAMAEKYERMARDAARTARQYSQAAEEVRKSAKKIQDKEAERQLLEKMRLDVDLTDDLETLQTRMKFTLETIEVVFGNMSVEEREEVFDGKKNIPWELYEVTFEPKV